MPEIKDIRQYVTEHIDEAIEKEDIKFYYQPVIRTITGDICEKEALARWDDPVYGLLLPEQFIPVLEEYKLIHKLDTFIIKKVCTHYNHCLNRNEPLIPISFNLSWLDFELCDIVGTLNDEIEKNRIPRDMIRVEINESLLSHDRDLIKNKLKIMHDLGYQIIMDDFGSGHSSINILKDYVFDELKIDMRVLWSEDDRARTIIGYLCSMTKALGIRTVAEGVENEEQVDFLFSKGCEKMQGYYFGKPMFYWDLVTHIKEKGYSTEPLNYKGYYDAISGTDLQAKAGSSFALAEFIDGDFHFLYVNEEYRKNMESMGIPDFATLENICSDPGSEVYRKFNAMLSNAKKWEEEQVSDLVWNGNYCIAKLKVISSLKDTDAVELSIENLSLNPKVNHLEKINNALNSIYSIFDRVVEVNGKKGKIRILHMETALTEKYESDSYLKNLDMYIEKEIYVEDRERYRQFADFKNILDRIGTSGRNYITGCFRFKNTKGNYVWKEQYIILAGSTGKSSKYLICTKDVDEKQFALLMQLSSLVSTGIGGAETDEKPDINDKDLWRSAIDSFDVGIFWKDMNRRFLGVNKVFLDYYGFESVNELLGKTDEDLNWHVDPVPFKSDEERVIKNGDIIRDAIGKCIAKGRNRNIIANKAPIRKDGKIVGLVGYFRDITDVTKKERSLRDTGFTDPVTGMLNTLGLMDSIIRYSEAYEDTHKDFVVIALNINQYKAIRDRYGEKYSDTLMKTIAERIKKQTGVSGVTARPIRDQFVIITQVERPEEGQVIMQALANDLRNIKEIDGVPCTVYTSAGYAAFSETGSGEALYSAAVKRMNDQMERIRRFTGGY